MALPSNSLATDLQKGQFFPSRGQEAPVSITSTLESTGDIIDDVHAQEEHAKVIAGTAEVLLYVPASPELHCICLQSRVKYSAHAYLLGLCIRRSFADCRASNRRDDCEATWGADATTRR